MPRSPMSDRRQLAAMLDAPAVTDVTCRVAALATAHFRANGVPLVAYCRYALTIGESAEQLTEFLLAGNLVIHVPEPGDGPTFVILSTLLMGDPSDELATPEAAADAAAIIALARD